MTKKLLHLQRFRRHPKNRKKAMSAQRKLKSIAGRHSEELRENSSILTGEIVSRNEHFLADFRTKEG